MNARAIYRLAAGLLIVLPSVAEALPIRSTWLQKYSSKIQKPLIVPMTVLTTSEPEVEYHVGDTVEATGRVAAYRTRSAQGMLTGCHGYIRRGDGKIVPYRVEAFPDMRSLLAVSGGDVSVHKADIPCGLLSAGLASQKPVTVVGRIASLSGTDPATGHPTTARFLLDQVELRDETFDTGASPSNAALTGISTGGTFSGGPGVVKRIVARMDNSDNFCEASVANEGGFFFVTAKTPAEYGSAATREHFASNWETLESATAQSMMRACDLLTQSLESGREVYVWGEQTAPARLANPDLEFYESPGGHDIVPSPLLF